MLRRAFLLLAAFCAANPVLAQLAPTETVAFATVGGQPLQLDFFRPPNATRPTPIVVWLHDGGWLTARVPCPTSSRRCSRAALRSRRSTTG